ncbi:hypothetical protein BRAS3843_330038 [Bradyrhizobium sp. STM 3843]|nr:hypothetical protein BRAS3843_330038 [Bradyrhizobium sp. STM 3843]
MQITRRQRQARLRPYRVTRAAAEVSPGQAPRDDSELAIAARIIAAAHCNASGRIGEVALPDSRW